MISAPILEFDNDQRAILEPRQRWTEGEAPRKTVLCFFQDVLQHLANEGKIKPVHALNSEIGANPIYLVEWEGQTLAVTHPGVGAPLAAGFLEELISMGMQQFVVCGGCGVLVHEIASEHVVVVAEAVRDEGTSYHYLPAARSVSAAPVVTSAIEGVLQSREVPYVIGKSWTTDALYRETERKRAARVAEGCSVVEMEAAALFAVAQFRRVDIGQVVYAGDLVVPEGWDRRGWNERFPVREMLFWLAVEGCAAIPAGIGYNRAR
ncbi:MAG: nucleoside phosphorylase [Anaerolineae bacterium]|nr:nucleoside phosphorylase [Anaerolineae bacterium]